MKQDRLSIGNQLRKPLKKIDMKYNGSKMQSERRQERAKKKNNHEYMNNELITK